MTWRLKFDYHLREDLVQEIFDLFQDLKSSKSWNELKEAIRYLNHENILKIETIESDQKVIAYLKLGGWKEAMVEVFYDDRNDRVKKLLEEAQPFFDGSRIFTFVKTSDLGVLYGFNDLAHYYKPEILLDQIADQISKYEFRDYCGSQMFNEVSPYIDEDWSYTIDKDKLEIRIKTVDWHFGTIEELAVFQKLDDSLLRNSKEFKFSSGSFVLKLDRYKEGSFYPKSPVFYNHESNLFKVEGILEYYDWVFSNCELYGILEDYNNLVTAEDILEGYFKFWKVFPTKDTIILNRGNLKAIENTEFFNLNKEV